jgi:preprotein translocase SecE subunit
MARDRQRAKQRRRRQGGAAPRGGRSSANARDIGLDDATVDDAGLGERHATPDSLKHSSADVDEAKLAEQGAIPPEVGEELVTDEELVPEDQADLDPDELVEGVYEDELHDDDFERAPDEAEENTLVPAGSGTHPEIAHERAPRKPRGRVLTFLRHCADELRRVQWPNRRQVGQATAVVLGFVVIAGGYLGLLDALWKPLVDAIL